MTLEEMFTLATQRHRAGGLADAERLYRQVLRGNPGHAGALNQLGSLAHQTGRHDLAADMFGRAVALQPRDAECQFNLGLALAAQGRLDAAIVATEAALALDPDMVQAHHNLGCAYRNKGAIDPAIACYRRAVALRPDYAEALANLGEALGQTGKLEEAAATLGRAAELMPQSAEVLCNFGNVLCQAGQWDRALACLTRALALRPDMAGAYNNLGNVFFAQGDLDQAVACYRRAISLDPDNAQFHGNLAVVLRDQKMWDQAIACCRTALSLQPDDAGAYSNLGSALAGKGDFAAAQTAYCQALTLRPNFLEPLGNLGQLYYMQGQWEKAREVHRQVLDRQPDHAQAHWGMALILLTLGDFEQGWREYEWRWRVKELRLRRRTESARWDGGPLNGRTILIHNEQGFGDSIHFARYLPDVARRGGRIVLACQPELFSLLGSLEGVEQCIPNDLPDSGYDLACPLLSLPGVFGTTLATIPASVPYLRPEPSKVQHWRRRLETIQGKTIGLVWGGRPTHANDSSRSLALSQLAPLADVGGIKFISLQKGPATQQIRSAPMEMVDWTDELNDFSDTAALIAGLDLVISVDTAVVHLAGAMAKPIWALLPFVPDWRWMLNRVDSPWYPTMRLFRQPRPNDWGTPVGQVAMALRDL